MKKVRKEFIRQAHAAACREWKAKIEKEFPKLFSDVLEVGKWYWLKSYGANTLINFQGHENQHYGFSDDHWTNDFGNNTPLNMLNPVQATLGEVEEALIEEAKKRGLVKDAYVKDADGRFGTITDNHWCLVLDLSLQSCNFSAKGNVVYFIDGKWAKPITNAMTKEEAEKKFNIVIK